MHHLWCWNLRDCGGVRGKREVYTGENEQEPETNIERVKKRDRDAAIN